jgi:hypothetical protein
VSIPVDGVPVPDEERLDYYLAMWNAGDITSH